MNDLSLPFLLCRKIAVCCVVCRDCVVILCFVEIMFSISFVACYISVLDLTIAPLRLGLFVC